MAGSGESNQALFLQQNAADTLLRNTSTLQVLLNMGFPKHRALKALIATGGAGVQVACDWIFAHVKDPTLDDHVPREFILYACPTGPMGEELEKYWNDSLVEIGRNGVHNSFPHVTLCGFFKCKDETVHTIIKALQNVLKKSETSLQNIGLEFFSSGNYVGLFLGESGADYLRKLSQDFANAVASTASDTQIEPHSNKQLHITLAYKFVPNQFKSLEALAKKIDLKKPCRWEIRLYSKETRFSNSETQRVLYPFSPSTENHLQLINGDYIFVNADAQMSSKSMDGFNYGTSWMTGCSGLFPASHVERTADAETWTLHKAIPILHQMQSFSNKAVRRRYSRGADEFHSSGYSSSDALLQKQIPTVPEATSTDLMNVGVLTDGSSHFSPVPVNTTSVSPVPSGRSALKVNEQKPPSSSPVLPPRRLVATNNTPQSNKLVITPPTQPKEDVYAKVSKPRGQVSVVPQDIQVERRIYIFRHAERVDITFGKGWIQLSFDEKGDYHRRNINMPQKIPKRAGGPKDFHRDSPAFLTGQAMRNIGASVHHVYSSPSLRCVETVTSLLKGMEIQSKVPVRVDLGLFEWMKWSQGGLPKFLDNKSLKEYGINVDLTYTQKFHPKDLKQDENCSEYFHRSNDLITSILKETTGDILICGHAGSLDGLSSELQGLSPRPMTEFVGIVTKVPYCGSIVLEEIPAAGIWHLIDPPYPALTHAPNPRFDWRMLLN